MTTFCAQITQSAVEMSQALWVACGAIGGATLAMVLFGMPLSAAAEVDRKSVV